MRGRARSGPPCAALAARVAAAVLAAAFLVGGCDGGTDADAIDRETFVATWVDLRSAAMRHGEAALPEPERARILADHGVTDDDLLRFAEVHGGDIAYMKAVWDEVEVRLQERGPGGAETAPDVGPGSTD